MQRHAERLQGAAIPAWWVPLLERCRDPSIFLSAEWLQTWLDVYGGDFTGHWIRWEVDGGVVAGCLLTRRTIWRYVFRQRVLAFNASGVARERTPFAEFNDVPCVAGHEDAVLDDLLAFLQGARWDRLSLSGYDDSAMLGRLAGRLPPYRVVSDAKPAPYVDFAGLAGATVEATLGGRYRAQIRRCRELCEQQMGPVTMTAARTVEEAIGFFDELARLHNDRWRSKGDEGSFQTRAVVEFHRSIIARLWQRQAVELLRVRAGDTVIGCIYNFVENGKVYFFQSGYLYDDNPNMRPGLLSQLMAIEHCRSRGLAEYDFLAGDARYKRMFSNRERLLHWTVVYRNNLSNRLFFAAKALRSMFARGGE